MARVTFTAQLQRFTDTPRVDVSATTLRAALDAAFAVNPRLRGYVLDDQSRVRAHVAVFADGQHHRRPLGERRRGHAVALGGRAFAADLRSALRLTLRVNPCG